MSNWSHSAANNYILDLSYRHFLPELHCLFNQTSIFIQFLCPQGHTVSLILPTLQVPFLTFFLFIFILSPFINYYLLEFNNIMLSRTFFFMKYIYWLLNMNGDFTKWKKFAKHFATRTRQGILRFKFRSYFFLIFFFRIYIYINKTF